MGTVPSRNLDGDNMDFESSILADKFPNPNKKDKSFYVTTRKLAIVQADDANGHFIEGGMLKNLSDEIKTDESLGYALAKFNNNLQSVLENKVLVNDTGNELRKLDIARNHYKVFGFDQSAKKGVDTKLNALKTGEKGVGIERVSPVLNDILAETQNVLGDFLVRVKKMSLMELDEKNENKTYKMLVDAQMLVVENKIAQGIGVHLEDEESKNMIIEIKKALEDAGVVGDLGFLEETSLRAVKATIDMQRYNYARDLNNDLITERIKMKNLGIHCDADAVKIAEMLLNRVKISLLEDLNYMSIEEAKNDLYCIANGGKTGAITSHYASDVVRAFIQYAREHKCECDDEFTCSCYEAGETRELILGGGYGQVEEAKRLYKLIDIQANINEVGHEKEEDQAALASNDDNWANDLDVAKLL